MIFATEDTQTKKGQSSNAVIKTFRKISLNFRMP